MSIEKPTQRDLEQAYFHGLQHMGNIDPDVARDLGYDVSPEDFKMSTEGELGRHGIQLANPELQAEFDQMVGSRQDSRGAHKRPTIKEAQQNAARARAKHYRQRGEERRAANK